jgi:hypothetical protein
VVGAETQTTHQLAFATFWTLHGAIAAAARLNRNRQDDDLTYFGIWDRKHERLLDG